MITLTSISLTSNETITIYNSNGTVAATLDQSNYVAESNTGQQNGWYSLYDADQNFQRKDLKLANVFLAIGLNGSAKLLA